MDEDDNDTINFGDVPLMLIPLFSALAEIASAPPARRRRIRTRSQRIASDRDPTLIDTDSDDDSVVVEQHLMFAEDEEDEGDEGEEEAGVVDGEDEKEEGDEGAEGEEIEDALGLMSGVECYRVWRHLHCLPSCEEIANYHNDIHSSTYYASPAMARFLMTTVEHVTTNDRVRFIGMTYLDGWSFTGPSRRRRTLGTRRLAAMEQDAIAELAGRIQALLAVDQEENASLPPPTLRALLIRVLIPVHRTTSLVRNEAYVLALYDCGSTIYYFDPLRTAVGYTSYLSESYNRVICEALGTVPEEQMPVTIAAIGSTSRASPFCQFQNPGTAIWCVWIAVCMGTEGMNMDGLQDFIHSRMVRGSLSAQIRPFALSMRYHMTAMLVLLYTSIRQNPSAADQDDRGVILYGASPAVLPPSQSSAGGDGDPSSPSQR